MKVRKPVKGADPGHLFDPLNQILFWCISFGISEEYPTDAIVFSIWRILNGRLYHLPLSNLFIFVKRWGGGSKVKKYLFL